MKRRVWPWVLLAILLLILACALVLFLAPAPVEGSGGVAYRGRDRWLILATGEVGWLMLILSARAWLTRSGTGLVARAGRFMGVVVLAAGLGLAAAGGWLMSSFLSANVHGTPTSSHGHHWDD